LQHGEVDDEGSHPTRERLISVVLKLLETHPRAEITTSKVLALSGASASSMYHYFKSFPALLEAAEIRRFSQQTDETIALFVTVLSRATNAVEFRARLRELLLLWQGEGVGAEEDRLARRIVPLTAVAGYERLRGTIGVDQQRLTGALAGIFAEAQAKGWITPQLDARAAAVMFQAYTLGKIVDDISMQRMDRGAWDQMVDRTLERVFS